MAISPLEHINVLLDLKNLKGPKVLVSLYFFVNRSAGGTKPLKYLGVVDLALRHSEVVVVLAGTESHLHPLTIPRS